MFCSSSSTKRCIKIPDSATWLRQVTPNRWGAGLSNRAGLTASNTFEIQELELITCARLAPVGSALVPWLPVPETQVRLRAKVEVISSRRFLLHFRSLDQLLLPTRNENLNITFLDDEIMIARSGDGAVFFWLRA